MILVLDVKNKMGYPKHAQITEVEKDTNNENRYFICKYKNGNKEMKVKRTAQSIVLLIKKAEIEDAKLTDSLFWCPANLDDDQKHGKLKVKAPDATDEIVDL